MARAPDWALYVKYTGSGKVIGVNADTMMDSMSTIKIPILVTLYRMADAGQIDLAQTLLAGDALQTLRHRRPSAYGRWHGFQPA